MQAMLVKELGGPDRMELSELLPHLGGVADRLTIVRSMHTDQFNHAPAQLLMHTGAPRPGRASMGSKPSMFA